MSTQVADDTDAVELLRQIGGGSEAAMRQFFDAHQRLVYSFALRRLSDAADAADVLNDVMLQVWRSADRFAGKSKVTTWLLGIANHKVLDIYRRRGRNDYDELDDTFEDENAEVAGASIALAEDADLVRRCLDKLSEAHREVVYLTFYEEMSYPDIAEALDCPTGTIKTRMMHAKKHLHRCLGALQA
jgi:RNA polymerase sigma-70 factor (ECF subfamily)